MPAEMVASQPPSREPASSDRLPVHRSEYPTAYSSAGCSPAEPASASPVTDIVAQSRSSAAIKCAAQLPREDAAQVALLVPVGNASVISDVGLVPFIVADPGFGGQ